MFKKSGIVLIFMILNLSLCLNNFNADWSLTIYSEEILHEEVRVCLNGEYLYFDIPPVVIEGRTLVPMRTIFEKLGYTVDWNEYKQRIIAKNGSSSIQLDIGDTLAILNDYDSAVSLDVPAQIINGRTMVPLRFVAEAAYYDVLWDERSNTVYIEPLFDGIGAPRQYQKIAMLNDELVFTGGYKISHDGKIFEEVQYANSNSLQIVGDFLYYRNNEFFLCRANIKTDEIEKVTDFPVANVTVVNDKLYYSKMSDSSHVLFQSDLEGNNEKLVINQPCDNYRIMDDKIYYIHMHNRKLFEYSLTTGGTKIIYDDFTTCLDISSDHKVYYGMAKYTDEKTPLIYKGVGCFDALNDSIRPVLELKDKRVDDLWVLGDNLFYQAEFCIGHYDLYRYSLKYGYDIKILSDILGGTEIHGKRIFYYPANDDYPLAMAPEGESALYIANTRGSNGFPLMSLVFSGIGWYAVKQNVPEQEYFDDYLDRDIKNYVGEKYGNFINYEYLLLSKQPETDMNGGASFYVWIELFSVDNTLMDAGVICLRAKDKEQFIVSHFTSREEIIEDTSCVNAYPKVIRKRILELAGI